MFHKCVTLSLIASLLLAGCQAGTNERILVRSNSASPENVLKAPYNGQYRLYRGTAMAPAAQQAEPVMTRTLSRGDLIGFTHESRGRLLAVTRTERTPLDDPATQTSAGNAAYTWTVQPDPGQVDPTKTALLVLGVGALVGIGVGITIGVVAAERTPWVFH